MKHLSMAAAAVACGLLMSACSKNEPEAASAATGPASTAASPSAASIAAQRAAAQTYPRVDIDTDAGLFWFEPRRCAIGPDPDSGAVHFSIEGAGQSPDGQPVYVTVEDEDDDPDSSPEWRINVGTDQPLKTTERVWMSNDGTAHMLKVPATTASVEGQRLTLQGAVFSQGGSERLVTQGPVQVDCAQPK